MPSGGRVGWGKACPQGSLAVHCQGQLAGIMLGDQTSEGWGVTTAEEPTRAIAQLCRPQVVAQRLNLSQTIAHVRTHRREAQ